MRAVIAMLALSLAACASPTGPARPPIELSLQDRRPDPACTAHWVAGVRGRVRDQHGEPLTSGHVQMCLRTEDGAQLCLQPNEIDAEGWYRVVLDPEIRCLQQVTLRVTQIGQPRSTTFCRTTMIPAYGLLDVEEDLVLHDLETPLEHPPVGDATSMRTVRFPSGLELDVRPGDLEFPDIYEQLVAGPVDPTTAGCFAEHAPPMLAFWAFGPEAGVAPGAPLRIPETRGLPEGTSVELWIVGGTFTRLASGEDVEEGELVPYGTGTVQGGFVVPDVGSELPYLSWLGYRAR